jgi:hypothetical protein
MPHFLIGTSKRDRSHGWMASPALGFAYSPNLRVIGKSKWSAMKTNLIWPLLFASLAFTPISAQNADISKRFSPEFVKAARRVIPLIRETAVRAPRDLVVQRILRMADAEAEIQTRGDQVVFLTMESASEAGWSPERVVICTHELRIMLERGTLSSSEACGDKSEKLPPDLQRLIPDEIKPRE